MNLFTSLLLLSLSAAPSEDASPTWLTDYGVALRQAHLEGVPLLVVLDDPADPSRCIEQVSAAGDSQELLKSYKLCHIDVRTPYGARTAKAFAAREFPRTVIIDNTASVQIFRKTGRFAAGQWRSTLAAYKDGQYKPAPAVRTSNYRPPSYRSPAFRLPASCST
jgi:hypothetical protein